MAGVYSVKYAGKAEKIAQVETEHAQDSEVVEYLKTRMVGSCMTFFRHNGGKIAELHHDVAFFPLEFLSSMLIMRPLSHQHYRANYPNEFRYLTPQEKILFRPSLLQHLRVEQWYRYYATTTESAASTAIQTAELEEHTLTAQRGFTHAWRELHNEHDDELNPNYDEFASSEKLKGTQV